MGVARYKRAPREERTWRGRVYDSKLEMGWAMKLWALNDGGKISGLAEQVPFVLIPKDGKLRPVTYRADFVFTEAGQRVVLDAKGHRTEIYKIKKRLMKHILGIEIEEVR